MTTPTTDQFDHAPLTNDELVILDQFLTKHVNEETKKALNVTYLHGFLSALNSAPSFVQPEMWQEVLFPENFDFEAPEFTDIIVGLLERFELTVVDLLLEETFTPLLHDGKPLSEWCIGYLDATGLDDAWTDDEEMQGMLFPLMILTEEFSLVGQEDENGTIIADDSAIKQEAIAILPGLIPMINEYWAESMDLGEMDGELDLEEDSK